MNLIFLMRHSLMAFVEYTFAELFPQTPFSDSPHLAIIAAKLEECAAGKCKRLIICLPPRSLKSVMASVAFPAWALAKYPYLQIICASYGQGLSDKHARDTRTIMASAGYQRAFATRLCKQKLSVDDFMTTRGGFRMATSVGGVLTGRGGDILIIDDPMKPGDAFSETLRKSANDWYDNTLLSRLNNKQDGVIIVVMQRLHQDDLVGHCSSWTSGTSSVFPLLQRKTNCMSRRPRSAKWSLDVKPVRCWIHSGRRLKLCSSLNNRWATMPSRVNTNRIRYRWAAPS
jgi:hypothetical protein